MFQQTPQRSWQGCTTAVGRQEQGLSDIVVQSAQQRKSQGLTSVLIGFVPERCIVVLCNSQNLFKVPCDSGQS